MSIAKQVLIFIIRIYQLTVSPILTAALGPSGHCRFTPSCSEYARQAIRLHGAMRGSLLAAWRLCRCHPWGKSGEDWPPQPGRAGTPCAPHRKAGSVTYAAPLELKSILFSNYNDAAPSGAKSAHCHGS